MFGIIWQSLKDRVSLSSCIPCNCPVSRNANHLVFLRVWYLSSTSVNLCYRIVSSHMSVENIFLVSLLLAQYMITKVRILNTMFYPKRNMSTDGFWTNPHLQQSSCVKVFVAIQILQSVMFRLDTIECNCFEGWYPTTASCFLKQDSVYIYVETRSCVKESPNGVLRSLGPASVIDTVFVT